MYIIGTAIFTTEASEVKILTKSGANEQKTIALQTTNDT